MVQAVNNSEGVAMSIATGAVSVITWRKARPEAANGGAPLPEHLVSSEFEQNRRTWAALRRLGVRRGEILPLHFFFETEDAQAAGELGDFLTNEAGYRVVAEQGGLCGWTTPMALGLEEIDEWVRSMLYAGFQHGGCTFAGWTATVSAGERPSPEIEEASDEVTVAARGSVSRG